MRSYSRLQYLFLVALLALAVANDGEFTSCLSSGQCGSNQCCLRDPNFSDTLNTCAPLVPEGGDCFVSNELLLERFKRNFSYRTCPCQVGFFCHSVADFSNAGTCVKPCTSTADCAKDECCEMLTLLTKRKKRDVYLSKRKGQETDLYLGKCQKYGAVNDTCYVSDRKGDKINFLCPCGSGLYCQEIVQADNVLDDEYPIGQSGNCVPVDDNNKAIPGK